MKREAANQALIILLVVALVAAGAPAAYLYAQESGAFGLDSGNGAGQDGASGAGDGSGAPGTGSADDPTRSPASPGAGGSGSALTADFDLTRTILPSLNQPEVPGLDALSSLLSETGTALDGGAPLETPDLEVELPAVNPLRVALLAWVEATGANVPEDELAQALVDADQVPQHVQRDLAVLVASAAQATLLQREALSTLTADEVAWLEANPDAVRDLLESDGTDTMTPDARRVADLAAKVDTQKTLQASLLLMKALEETREPLRAAAEAGTFEPGSDLPLVAGLQDEAWAFLDVLMNARERELTDVERMRVTADLLAAGAGLDAAADPRPYAPALDAEAPLPDAIVRLVSEADPEVSNETLELAMPSLARARALPLDLQRALALVVHARADTIAGVRDAVLSGADEHAVAEAEAVGALKTLSAMEQALPTIQKYAILWSDARPWDAATIPEPAVGYVQSFREAHALTHGAGTVDGIVRAAGLSRGIDAQPEPLGEVAFVDAVVRLRALAGHETTPEELDALRTVANDNLPRDVQRAAAFMIEGTTKASLARDRAFADVTEDEYRFLLEHAADVEAIVRNTDALATEADVALLNEYRAIASRVDAEALVSGALTLARATETARGILVDAGYDHDPSDKPGTQSAQSTDATPVATGWRGLLERVRDWLAEFSPVGTARGQGPAGAETPCTEAPVVSGLTDCRNDVLFRDPFTGLHITGTGTSVFTGGEVSNGFRTPYRIPVLLDIGGNDVYNVAVGSYGETPAFYYGFPCGTIGDGFFSLYAGVALDMAGHDVYATPDLAPCYNEQASIEERMPWRGTQGAGFGGIGILVENGGFNDFRGFSHTQGFGWLGVGVLASLGEDADAFSAERLAQGATYPVPGPHLGILVNDGGANYYDADEAMGYGAGAVFMDLKGDDRYVNAEDPHGLDTTAYLHVDQRPATLHGERGNNKVWRDGPSNVHLGIGVDTVVEPAFSDGTLWPDLVQALLGSDPRNPQDTPDQAAMALLFEDVLRDSSGNGYPDVVEGVFGTAPVGVPGLPRSGVAGSEQAASLFLLYETVVGAGRNEGVRAPYDNDKIVDLRVPLPGSGLTLDAMCDDYASWAMPRTFTGGLLYGAPSGNFNTVSDDDERDDPQSPVPIHQCGRAVPGFARGGGNTTASDDGRITQSGGTTVPDGDGERPVEEELELRVPPGIFAIGNAQRTTYDIDYLLTIDIAGSDGYLNRAGGAGLLWFATRDLQLQTPGDSRPHPAGIAALRSPVGLTSFDVDVPPRPDEVVTWGRDTYRAQDADGDLLNNAHGAGTGILVDTVGDDTFIARDYAQGALGGLLVNLRGDNTYIARNHAQGAAVVLEGQVDSPLQANQREDSSQETGPQERRTHRVMSHLFSLRPALLLDFEGTDTYHGGNRSQGYAAGLVKNVGPSGTERRSAMPYAFGTLVDLDGEEDSYRADRFAQGVGRGGGTGLLLDGRGDDTYSAFGPSTMGGIEPLHQNQVDGEQSLLSGVGILADLAGLDEYERRADYGIVNLTAERQDQVTERTDMGLNAQGLVVGSGSEGSRRFVSGVGVHADADVFAGDADGLFSGVSSLGGGQSVSDVPESGRLDGFLVHMPSARLAIGGNESRAYTDDYAFIVEFGGDNTYRNNAGGPIMTVLGEEGAKQVHLLLTAYPVTFVYEAARGNTTYVADRDMAQATGYFTVGMVVDEGGEDVFDVARDTRPALPSRWTPRAPLLNGDIQPRQWTHSANTTQMAFLFEETRTEGQQKNVTLYVANDAEYAYFALEYEPEVGDRSPEEVLRDTWFRAYFDIDSDETASHPGEGLPANQCTQMGTQRRDGDPSRTYQYGTLGSDHVRASHGPGLDGVLIGARDGTEVAADQTFGVVTWGSLPAGWNGWHDDCQDQLDSRQDVEGARKFEDGKVTITFRKALASEDPQDINILPDGQGGWLNPTVGFRMSVYDAASNAHYAWPPGSAGYDGEPGTSTRGDRKMGEEILGWGTLTLAGAPHRTPEVNHTWRDYPGMVGVNVTTTDRERYLAQGAGVGGVGLLALTGSAHASTTLNADAFAQGFGGWNGYGLVYSGGGSDRFTGTDFVQGAAQGIDHVVAAMDTANPYLGLHGVGVLVNVDGNDVYTAETRAQGYGPQNLGPTLSQQARGLSRSTFGLFLDLGGHDAYVYADEPLKRIVTELGDPETRPLNDRAWLQRPAEDGQQEIRVPFVTLTADAPGGIGIDLDLTRRYVHRFTQLATETSLGIAAVAEPQIRYRFHPVNETGCDTEETVGRVQPDGGAEALYMNGTVCLRAFVFFNASVANPEAPTNNRRPTAYVPTPPGLSPERLDVLVDGFLYESLTHGDLQRASAFGLSIGPDGEAPADFYGYAYTLGDVDTAEIDDGVLDMRLRAYFRTATDPSGPIMYAHDSMDEPETWDDQTTGREGDVQREAFVPHQVLLMSEDRVPNLLVDNLPCVERVDARPLLNPVPRRVVEGCPEQGDEERQVRAFSPTGIGSVDGLEMDWVLARDLDQDRYEMAGYNPYRNPRDLPCGEAVDAYTGDDICTVIPFFIKDRAGNQPGNSDVSFGTERPQDPRPRTAPLATGTNGQHDTMKITMPPMRTTLSAVDGEALRFALFRDVILPAGFGNTDYTTVVEIFDTTGNGESLVFSGSSTATVSPTSVEQDRAILQPALQQATFEGINALVSELVGREITGPSDPVEPSPARFPDGREWWYFTLPAVDLNGDPLVLHEGRSYQVNIRVEPPEGSTRHRGDTVIEKCAEESEDVPFVSPNTCRTFRSSSFPIPHDWMMVYGSADFPARMEIVVPSHASTHVDVTATPFADADVTYPVSSVGPVVGGYAGYAPFSWDGSWTGGDVPSGLYNLTLTPRTVTADDSPLAGVRGEDAGAPLTVPVILDREAPDVEVITPSTLGAGLLTSGGDIPFRWRTVDPGTEATPVSGTGVDAVTVWAAAAPDGRVPVFNSTNWGRTHQRPELAPTASLQNVLTSSDADTYYVVVAARDRVGNVLGLPDDWSCAAPEDVCERRAMRDAVSATIASARAGENPPNLYRFTIDRLAPHLYDGQILGSNEAEVNGVLRTVVQAGNEDASLRVCVSDAGSGVRQVSAVFVRIPDDPQQPILDHERTMTRTSGSCYAYDGWGTENTDAEEWPNGLWLVGFEALDRGSNRGELEYGFVYLDGEQPEAVAFLDLPERQTAVKSGDTFRIVVRANDTLGIDESALTADVSAVSTEEPSFRAVTRDGVRQYEATIRVDREGIAQGLHTITWAAPDLAGNDVGGELDLHVLLDDFGIVPGSVRVVDADHESVVLAWNTTEETTAAVRWDVRHVQGDLRNVRHFGDELTRTHRVVLTGLDPSTRYYLQVESANAAGLTQVSDVFDEVTATALFVAPRNLGDGDAFSGEFPLEWDGGLRDGSGSLTSFTVEMRRGGAWEFVSTVASRDLEHVATVNTTRFIDGNGYDLRIVAEAGRDHITHVIEDLVVDNTLPEVALDAGARAAKSQTPVVTGTVRDALAGVDVTSLGLVVNGERLPDAGFVVDGETGDGAVAFRYPIEDALAFGTHEVTLFAADRAGNRLEESWTLHVDDRVPDVAVNGVRYAPGPIAAAEGARVTLNVTARDASGMTGVVADAAALVDGAEAVAFTRVPGTDHYEATFTLGADVPDGDHVVLVTATDLAGNTRNTTATVVVDNARPVIDNVRSRDADLTGVVIGVTASEPVTVEIAYEASSSDGVIREEKLATSHVLFLEGLLPSRTYTYTVTVTDGAGNVATREGTFETAADIEPPADVPDLVFHDLRDGRIRLEWPAAKDDVGVAFYRIYRSEDGVTFTQFAETENTWFEASGMALDADYHYQVAAVDWGGNEGPRAISVRGASTTLPVLSDASVTPDAGSAQTTTFKFTVTYTSPGGVAPAYVRVVLNGVPHDMRQVDGEDPAEGLVFEYETTLPPTTLDNPHTFLFEASDGRYIVKFPEAEPMRGPLVDADLLSGGAEGLVNFAQRIPFLGAAGLLGVVSLAAAAAVILNRRRSGP